MEYCVVKHRHIYCRNSCLFTFIKNYRKRNHSVNLFKGMASVPIEMRMDNVDSCPKDAKDVEERGGERSEQEKFKRLPLFGPLCIEDIGAYYDSARERFNVLFEQPSSDVVNPEDFLVLKLLGKGSFGKVLLVRDKNQVEELYAMKAIGKQHTVKAKQVQHALNEKRILQSVDFPFGVRLEHFSKDSSFIYLFMPYIPGGDMFVLLRNRKTFEETTSVFFAAQVVLGLEYLHQMRLVYRDLKPENLLIDCYGYLKITDFGFSKMVSTRTYTFCGTPQYLAPEVILGHGHGRAVDWWSLGVLIYEMVAGYPPFDSHSNITLFRFITKSRYIAPTTFSKALRDIIKQLLEPDLSKRLGNLKGGSADLKSHEWFNHVDWMDVFNRKMEAPLVPPCPQVEEFANNPRETVGNSSHLSESPEYQIEDEFKDF